MDETTTLQGDGKVDAQAFRLALGRFATGIVAVTTCDDRGQPYAITVNAFTSVSLDPPLVLFCLGKAAFHVDVFARAEAFAINVLNADQQDLSNRFAREEADDLTGLRLGRLRTGSPILPGCLAALDCTIETRHEAGDHIIVVGRVCAIDSGAERDPLIYFGSRYRTLKPSCDG
jgi:flavin reductase (DIM6/NTAB) family NADH-FMN oxidoreductase RutF